MVPVKTHKPKSVRPYALLNATVGKVTTNVMSGKVYLEDLPNVGDYVTVSWHHDNMKYATTHAVIMVDENDTGDMWLQTHWKGWVR